MLTIICVYVYHMYRSNDGLVLVVSSSDGYCSLIGFEPGELGQPLQQDKLPACMRHTSPSSSSSPLSSSPSPLTPSSKTLLAQKESESPHTNVINQSPHTNIFRGPIAITSSTEQYKGGKWRQHGKKAKKSPIDPT